MPNLKIPTFASMLHDLLQWSLERPPWQQDGLRRIILKGEIDETDLLQLTHLCLARHDLAPPDEFPLTAEPLRASHIPQTPGMESSVALVAVETLKHVNRLATDQCLTFIGGIGLTVIYGENGTGKSGFARVIKKACRTRGSQPIIRPNAFSGSATQPASATIKYRINDTHYTVAWNDGTPAIEHLSNVFVFDTFTAKHYLDEDGPTSFTPRGLDILPTLSKLADTISVQLDGQIVKLESEIANATKSFKTPPGTSVFLYLANLTATSKTDEIENLSAKYQEAASRLSELSEALRADAKHHAKSVRAAALRIRNLVARLEIANANISLDRYCEMKALTDLALASTQAAKSFSMGSFDASFLPGTGGEAWRVLWNAARAYATSVAYPGKLYPPFKQGDKCVLCQQDLDALALNRLSDFDAYCQNQSIQVAATALASLEEAKARLATSIPILEEWESVESDLVNLPESEHAALCAFIAAHNLRLTSMHLSCQTNNWPDLQPIPTYTTATLANLASTLDIQASLEEAADDPVIRENMIQERDEIAAQLWLVDNKELVVAQINRFVQLNNLKKCKKDTSTKKITEKNTELTSLLVTEAFCNRFKDEIAALGLKTLVVTMQDIEGKKGQCKFGLRFSDAAAHKVRDIASEGEQRCIALAAFLAELSQASHKSSLVFDDPVSSLDHRHREKIARRLVLESKSRQVIIFTHDPVFLHDIQSHATNSGVLMECRHLEWSGGAPGHCREGLPWDFKTPQDKLDKLEKLQRALSLKWEPIPSEANVAAIREAYGMLRATIERIVEREALASVVYRFRSYIDIKQLKKVVDFGAPQSAEIERLHARCCDVTSAHDNPDGKNTPVPEPADFQRDIASTKQLLEAIRALHNGKLPISPPILKVAAKS